MTALCEFASVWWTAEALASVPVREPSTAGRPRHPHRGAVAANQRPHAAARRLWRAAPATDRLAPDSSASSLVRRDKARRSGSPSPMPRIVSGRNVTNVFV